MNGLTESLFTELLVHVVDVVLEGSGIDEKFLGLTLFALVPNTTEFMNAMSFAMYGNIALRQVSLFLGQIILILIIPKYGDRLSVRAAGLLAPDTCNGSIFGMA